MLPSRTPSVDRRFFTATVQAFARLGFDVPAACAAHDLPNPLDGEGERIPLAAVSRVYDLAKHVLGEPALAYKLVEASSHDASSVLFDLIKCCPTPMHAFRMLCRFAAIASDATRFDIADQTHGATVVLSQSHDVYVSPYQVEMAVWFLILGLRYLLATTGSKIDCQVVFKHPALFEPQAYAQLYGHAVSFGAEQTTVTLSGEKLHQPIPGHDERVLSYHLTHAEHYEAHTLAQGDFVHQVTLLFAQRMPFGAPDASEIATLLNISRRTLQRKLQEAGTCWAQVSSDAREHVARLELRKPNRSIQEVAMLTGYIDTRAFLRAFRRWTGQTPSEFRMSTG